MAPEPAGGQDDALRLQEPQVALQRHVRGERRDAVVAWSVPSEVGERRGSGQRTLRPDKCDGRDAGEGEHHHGALLLE